MSLKLSALLNPAPDSELDSTSRPANPSTPVNFESIDSASTSLHSRAQESHLGLNRASRSPAREEAPAQAEPSEAQVQGQGQHRQFTQDPASVSQETKLSSPQPTNVTVKLTGSQNPELYPLPKDSNLKGHIASSTSSVDATSTPRAVSVGAIGRRSESSKQDQDKMSIDDLHKPAAEAEPHLQDNGDESHVSVALAFENTVLEDVEGKDDTKNGIALNATGLSKGQEAPSQESVPSPLLVSTLAKDTISVKSRSATPLARESTPKGIAQIKEEEILMPAPSSSRSTPSRSTPTGTSKAARKGPPPKKGTTSKKPSTKPRSRAIDSPGSSRSATPASSRLSKTTNARNSSTPNNGASSPGADDDEENEIYCICRKPDNHTWMIACDGCDDWFHGRCVDMKEENAQLVDKYYCPRCADPSIGKRTTWLRVCRLSSCNQPANLTMGKESKYCSDEHGKAFFAAKISDQKQVTTESKKRKRSLKNIADTDNNNDDSDASFRASSPSSDPEFNEPAIGGRLGPRQLAKVIKASEGDFRRFKQLGSTVVSDSSIPDPSATTTAPALPNDLGSAHSVALSESEKATLETIQVRLAAIASRRNLLQDRDSFLTKTKETAKRLAREEGIKDLCGYDDRLSWGEEQFEAWRASVEGKAAMEGSDKDKDEVEKTKEEQTESDVKMTSDTDLDSDGQQKEQEQQICQRKRCAHHSNWKAIALEELHFDRRRLDDEERRAILESRELRERAALRNSAGGDDDGFRDGWVEHVAPPAVAVRSETGVGADADAMES